MASHSSFRAPPHTRGWTVVGGRKERRNPGSPAHAGMDPTATLAPASPARLPRTRGDGPASNCARAGPPRAPPHTRGWTGAKGRSRGDHPGSPAHAGMDPGADLDRRGHHGLPRTRGDGPIKRIVAVEIEPAPPHTRGWTHSGAAQRRDPAGSPAHAGMDPARCTARKAAIWLPRTRGDGPGRPWRMARANGAPPHTRGWTHRLAQERHRLDGSPAHAGMDPRPRSPRPALTGLPRTRGDGPILQERRQDQVLAPPHTRGWTQDGIGLCGRDTGSPAHAGMDPLDALGAYAPTGLPRTRGDGPVNRLGMVDSIPAPPHTRGWTRQRRRDDLLPPGSPAHAGMDRSRAA